MATTVNTTVERIELTALDKGAKGVIDGVRGSVGSLRAGVDTLNNALAAVGVTLGVGAMISFARDTLKATAALDDMAESTGASVEGLSAIRRVAQVGGHDFEGLTAQIGKTIKGLREGSEEGGRAAKAFEAVGVKTRDSSGRLRDMSEVLIEFAQKLDKYKESGDKTLLVQDALGRGAERYIPLLKDMAEGTDLVATTTARQAEEADKAEKAMRRVGVAFEDNRRILVNEYVPAFTEFMEQLTTGIKLFGSFSSALYNIGFGIDPFKGLQENLREINEELAKARAESPYHQAMRGSVLGGSSIETLEKRRAFLMFQAQQEARRLIDDSNMDARDLRLRGAQAGGREQLNYRPPPEGSDSKVLREAEFRAQKQVELEEMAAADSREAWDIYTKGRLDQEKQLREGQAEMMKTWFELIDQEQADAIERGQVYLESEQNQLQEHYANRLSELIRARELGILTQSEYDEREAELAAEHQRRLNGITTIAMTELEKFKRLSFARQTAHMVGMLADMTAGAAVHSKKFFELNKVASTAVAIVKGIEAVQSAYAFGAAWGGPIGGAAMAAIAAAATAVQVQAIQASTFGGGGAAGVYAANPASGLPVATQPAAPAARGPDTIINIRGTDMFSGRQLRELIERLNESSRDGGRILVSP